MPILAIAEQIREILNILVPNEQTHTTPWANMRMCLGHALQYIPDIGTDQVVIGIRNIHVSKNNNKTQIRVNIDDFTNETLTNPPNDEHIRHNRDAVVRHAGRSPNGAGASGICQDVEDPGIAGIGDYQRLRTTWK